MIFEDMTFVFKIHPTQIKGDSPAYDFINLLCKSPRRNYVKQISPSLTAIGGACPSGPPAPRVLACTQAPGTGPADRVSALGWQVERTLLIHFRGTCPPSSIVP